MSESQQLFVTLTGTDENRTIVQDNDDYIAVLTETAAPVVIKSYEYPSFSNSGPSDNDFEAREFVFTNATLSIIGYLTYVHGLDRYPRTILIYDNNNEVINPTSIVSTTSTLTANLSDFTPLQGNWRLMVT